MFIEIAPAVPVRY